MSVYFDASALLPLFITDTFSERADAIIAMAPAIVVADWAAVEVSSVIAKQARMGAITREDAQTAFANFDTWRASVASAETTPADMLAASHFVRRADLALRGPDALHIAIAQRLGAKLVTFDASMAAAAAALGLDATP